MVDIVEAFQEALAESPGLGRWELSFNFPSAGVDHAQSLTLKLTKRGAGLVQSLPAQIGAPYAQQEDGIFRAQGRSIFIGKNTVRLGIRASGYEGTAWDGGVQDALLASILRSVGRGVSSVVTERWTDTHFEEPGPRTRKADEGRELLAVLVTHRAFVKMQVSEYWTKNVANPELRLVLEGPWEGRIGARMGRPSRWKPVREGTYRCRVDAFVHTFPHYQQGLKAMAHDTLWTSGTKEVNLEPGDRLVVTANVPSGRRRLNGKEKAFFEGGEFPGVRENVEFAMKITNE